MKLPDRLPALEGRGAALVRIAYAVVAILVTGIVLASVACDAVAYFRDLPATAHYGFELEEGDSGRPVIAGVAGAARTAGMSAGDQVVALNGARLADDATLLDAGETIVRSTGPLSIDTENGAGAVSRHVLPRTQSLDQVNAPKTGLPIALYAGFQVGQRLLLTLTLLSISWLLARKRPRDPEAMLLSFGFVLLAYGNTNLAWLWQLHLPLSADVVGWTDSVFAVLGFWAMFVGFSGFPDGRFTTLWARLAWMVPTAYVLANAATGFVLWSHPFLMLAADVPIFSVVTGSVLLRYRQAAPGLQRQQIKWALFGGAVMVLASVVGFISQIPAVASLSGSTGKYLFGLFRRDVESVAFPLGVLVSLLRYRLYDADTVITRSTVYAVLAVTLVAVFACTEKIIELLGEEYFGERLGVLAGGLGAAIAAVLVAPFHHRISYWVEHRFRHDLLQLRKSLPVLMSDLRDTATPPELAEAALDRVALALHAIRGAVLGNDNQIFAAQNISDTDIETWREQWAKGEKFIDPGDHLFPVRVPLRTPREADGWLLLGARPDGSLYGKDERDALTELAGPIALGLAATTRREAMHAASVRDNKMLLERLDALERSVAHLSKHKPA